MITDHTLGRKARGVRSWKIVWMGAFTRPFARPEAAIAVTIAAGGTSASRTLVLLDGIPMNEPFAGWVYWPRVPLGLVKQVEVVRGGSAGSNVAGPTNRSAERVIRTRTEAPRRRRSRTRMHAL